MWSPTLIAILENLNDPNSSKRISIELHSPTVGPNRASLVPTIFSMHNYLDWEAAAVIDFVNLSSEHAKFRQYILFLAATLVQFQRLLNIYQFKVRLIDYRLSTTTWLTIVPLRIWSWSTFHIHCDFVYFVYFDSNDTYCKVCRSMEKIDPFHTIATVYVDFKRMCLLLLIESLDCQSKTLSCVDSLFLCFCLIATLYSRPLNWFRLILINFKITIRIEVSFFFGVIKIYHFINLLAIVAISVSSVFASFIYGTSTHFSTDFEINWRPIHFIIESKLCNSFDGLFL